jgi:hypothetical protein
LRRNFGLVVGVERFGYLGKIVYFEAAGSFSAVAIGGR